MSELDFSDFLHELHLEGPGFSWMSPESIMHKRTVNFVAVLFDLGLYGGGVISRPVELLDLRRDYTIQEGYTDTSVENQVLTPNIVPAVSPSARDRVLNPGRWRVIISTLSTPQ